MSMQGRAAEQFAEIIVDIAHADVDRVFTYRVPEGMFITPGMRARVPFGAQVKEGYVLGLTNTPGYDRAKIKDILEPIEPYPALLPQLTELAKELSVSAHCPLAEAIRLMLPAEMRGGRVKVRTEKAAQLTIPSG